MLGPERQKLQHEVHSSSSDRAHLGFSFRWRTNVRGRRGSSRVEAARIEKSQIFSSYLAFFLLQTSRHFLCTLQRDGARPDAMSQQQPRRVFSHIQSLHVLITFHSRIKSKPPLIEVVKTRKSKNADCFLCVFSVNRLILIWVRFSRSSRCSWRGRLATHSYLPKGYCMAFWN